MVSKQLSLSHGTRFLAVSLMDRFMDRHIVMKYRLKLVALTSLLIAGMFFIPLELQGAYPRYGIHTSIFAV